MEVGSRSDRLGRSRGFTLIELMITLVLLAIILQLAAPSFRSLRISQEVRNAAFDLSSALLYAREEAVKRNGGVAIAASSGDWDGGWQIKDGNDHVLLKQKAYDDISITATASSIAFNQAGRIDAGSAGFEIRATTGSPTITRCIKVDAGGRLNSVC